MLVDFNGKRVMCQPHGAMWNAFGPKVSPAEFRAIHSALDEYVATQGHGEVVTSSWIPGPGTKWENTPYQAILLAVDGSWDLAPLFFGLVVWNYFADHRPDAWTTPGRYPRYPEQIIGRTYFRFQAHRPIRP